MGVSWGYIGLREHKMETTMVIFRICWGYIGIMENKVETTIEGLGFGANLYSLEKDCAD